MTKAHTNEYFISRLKEVNPDIEPLSPYVRNDSKILCRCRKCGNEWSVVPSSLLYGVGCPKCNKRYRRNTEEFIEELKSINPYITVLGSYQNAHTNIRVRCNRCGNEWDANPTGLLKGNECPICLHSQTSIVEQILYGAFSSVVGKDKVVNRDRSIIGKELDIVIKSLNLAIEFGAWHWHSKRINRDVEKERLCENAGITLISIYEGCPEDADTGKLKNAICYRKSISSERDYSSIRGFILNICTKYGLDDSIIRDNWSSIVQEAKDRSRKKDAETFARELSVKNPSVEYVKGYSGAKDKVFVKCLICNTEWWASSAYDLLHGHGCPECAKIKRNESTRFTTEDYIQRVANINPQFELLNEYTGLNNDVRCRCNICGTEWTTKAAYLLYKRNCPNCSPVTKKSNNQFIEELSTISSDIFPIDEYVNGGTKIRFQCWKCGYIWSAKPHDVLRGTGCPQCANRIPISPQEFANRVTQANNTIQLIGKYIDRHTKIKCRCRVCGYEWMGLPNNLIRGAGCKRCAGTLRLTDDEFLSRLSSVNPSITPLENYVNISTKLLCHCDKCGNEWKASPGNLFAGHGCPKCKAEKAKTLRSKPIRCIETDQVYPSVKVAVGMTGIKSISDCLHHRTKTAGGYHWEFV